MSIVMIADSRVSWVPKIRPPRDFLRKLYTIDNGPRSIVLGFAANDLHMAKEIITKIFKQKLPRYSRPFVIPQVQQDIASWIKEVARNYPEEKRKDVKFMVSGLEPSRSPSIMKDGVKIGEMPFSEIHIATYAFDLKGELKVDDGIDQVKIIGSGQVIEDEIRKKAKSIFNFGYSNPKLRHPRAFVMGDVVSFLASENREVSDTVGGPFQIVRITPTGLFYEYVWPQDSLDKNVEVQAYSTKIRIFNRTEKKTYYLHPIWNVKF